MQPDESMAEREDVAKERSRGISKAGILTVLLALFILLAAGYLYLSHSSAPSQPPGAGLHSGINATGTTAGKLNLTNNSVANSSAAFSNQCSSDAQCPADYYCSNYNVCIKNTCGDGVCSAEEKASNSCAIDCGCPGGEIVNAYLNACQAPPNISNAYAANATEVYLRANNMTGTILAINESYFGNQSAKLVSVSCSVSANSLPCMIFFFVGDNGIISVLHST